MLILNNNKINYDETDSHSMDQRQVDNPSFSID